MSKIKFSFNQQNKAVSVKKSHAISTPQRLPNL
jgi:hypothetical protein